MVRPAVVLPEPDSPTSPTTSPGLMFKLTFSTALTLATTRENTPPRIGKYFLRSLTSKRYSRLRAFALASLRLFLGWIGLDGHATFSSSVKSSQRIQRTI